MSESEIKPYIISIPNFVDDRGELHFLEVGKEIDFDIKRIFYISNVGKNKSRGNHAHKKLKQLMIAISGNFDIIIDDGFSKKEFNLNNASKGLLVPPGHYGTLENFSKNAICLVCTSDVYDPSDYIFDYEEFLEFSKNKI